MDLSELNEPPQSECEVQFNGMTYKLVIRPFGRGIGVETESGQRLGDIEPRGEKYFNVKKWLAPGWWDDMTTTSFQEAVISSIKGIGWRKKEAEKKAHEAAVAGLTYIERLRYGIERDRENNPLSEQERRELGWRVGLVFGTDAARSVERP